MDRERLVGLRLGAYVASKVTVLVPFLLLVIVSMLGVLRLLDRLPRRPPSTYASMSVGLLLCLASYGDAGTQSTGTYWVILGAFAVVFLVATWGVMVRSTRRSMR